MDRQGEVRREIRREDAFWLLGSLCGLFRIPFDAALIAQNFPPPYTLATLHEAARALGIKTGQSALPSDWLKLPLPAIAYERPKSQDIPSNSSAPEDACPRSFKFDHWCALNFDQGR